MSETRACRKCTRTLPHTSFHRSKARADGLHPWCKDCRRQETQERRERHGVRVAAAGRDANLRHLYGITSADYERMLQEQDGVCASCGQPETTYDPRWKRVRRLAVDHDHETGRVRGLLCGACNRALGLLADSEHRIRQLADYACSRGARHSDA